MGFLCLVIAVCVALAHAQYFQPAQNELVIFPFLSRSRLFAFPFCLFLLTDGISSCVGGDVRLERRWRRGCGSGEL
jgi:hypothetical protein